MQLLKYQGAQMVPDTAPGDTVAWAGFEWVVTASGHLTTTATVDQYLEAVDLIRNSAASEVVPDGEASISQPIIAAQRAAEAAAAEG